MPISKNLRAHEDSLKADAVREVGILLSAFAPLDVALTATSVRTLVVGLTFLLLGISLFYYGLRMDRNVQHA